MPQRKKTELEKLQALGSHPNPQPHDKVEPLHIDEIRILSRVLAYMLGTHPDASRPETLDILTDIVEHFYAPLGLNMPGLSKPQPRRDVVEAARLIVDRYRLSQPLLARGTIFEETQFFRDE